jgi:hypothetical protein
VLGQMFASSDFGESIRIVATKSSIRELAMLIRLGGGEARLESEWGQLRLVIEISTDPRRLRFCMDREGAVLSVFGQQHDLELLALNLEGLSEADPPYHWHLEWFDEHYFLDPISTPCVFELETGR